MASPLTPYLRTLTSTNPIFTDADLRTCLHTIFTEDVPVVQTAAFLAVLRARGLDSDPRIIAAAAQTMKEFSHKVDVPPAGYVDVVGTGGDGKNTFNVSTTSGLVAAGLGLSVCKHGNRASTSTSGAADLLINLGASIQSVTPFTASQVLAESPFVFLFAPVYHPVFGKIAPVRKALGFPTIFNVLGPLLNPAPISYRIIGVNAAELGAIFARTIILLDRAAGTQSSSMIVWGEEGLDEISPSGNTRIWRVTPGSDEVVESIISPTDFGITRHALEEVGSGTAEENARVVEHLVAGNLPEGHPILDWVLINAAALAVVAGKAATWKDGVVLAREAIANGSAKKALESFVGATQRAKAEIDLMESN
ncbi:glycosyl transferase family, a/b domain-containing protein [Limtongia smithiae]|uniref:glycosyl transferase family, a/b domain-containing protein n=1 Tax=Limtongia smithiae TaxID=1125753 RepID=UPI0034CF3172